MGGLVLAPTLLISLLCQRVTAVSFRLASPSYSITPFADLVRRRSRTVCQQEFVLELTLLISLLCQRTTVSCWVLEMRPLLLFTFRSTSLMIFSESFRRQRARSFLTLKPEGR